MRLLAARLVAEMLKSCGAGCEPAHKFGRRRPRRLVRAAGIPRFERRLEIAAGFVAAAGFDVVQAGGAVGVLGHGEQPVTCYRFSALGCGTWRRHQGGYYRLSSWRPLQIPRFCLQGGLHQARLRSDQRGTSSTVLLDRRNSL